MKYKRFLVFHYEQYYPSGGLSDIVAEMDTLEEVPKFLRINYDNKFFPEGFIQYLSYTGFGADRKDYWTPGDDCEVFDCESRQTLDLRSFVEGRIVYEDNCIPLEKPADSKNDNNLEHPTHFDGIRKILGGD